MHRLLKISMGFAEQSFGMESQKGSAITRFLSGLGKNLLRIGPTVLGFALAGHLGLSLYQVGPKIKELAVVRHLVHVYVEAFQSIQIKAEKLRNAQVQSDQLKALNTRLTVQLESKRFECSLKAASEITHSRGLLLDQETGTKVGRTLSSLNYKVPERLSPAQLYTLGVNAVREQNAEKTAVIFSTLTGLEPQQMKQPSEVSGRIISENKYRTARNYLLAGVAWYSLDNYNLADYYLDEALKTEVSSENLPYHAQARLWKALILKKSQKEEQSQTWLKALLAHHPRSAEAHWINGSEEKNEKSETE